MLPKYNGPACFALHSSPVQLNSDDMLTTYFYDHDNNSSIKLTNVVFKIFTKLAFRLLTIQPPSLTHGTLSLLATVDF